METNTSTGNRGFASMDSHRQREIARKGGRAAHEKGRAHEFTAEEARAAGRKGGEKVSVNRRHMAEIGRRGGKSSAQRRRPQDETQNPVDRAAGHEQPGHEQTAHHQAARQQTFPEQTRREPSAVGASHQPPRDEPMALSQPSAEMPEVGTEQ